jgi:hypothetical protein
MYDVFIHSRDDLSRRLIPVRGDRLRQVGGVEILILG